MSFIISSSNILPWGDIHNDFTYFIEDYQSISHCLYASILPVNLRASIKKIRDVSKMKNITQIIYMNYLEEIAKEAIQDSFQVLLEDKELRNVFNSLKGIVYSTGNLNNLISTVINSVNTSKNVDKIELPKVFYDTAINKINLNDFEFNSILEVVYFYYYKFFLGSLTESYILIQKCKNNPECLEQQFQSLQKNYFIQRITDSASKYIPLKFTNINLLKLLNTLESNIQLKDSGFLNDIINPVSSSFVNSLKKSSPKFELLDINSLIEEEKDIQYWIKNVRCPDLKHTFSVLEKYTRTILSDTQLDLCFDLFYGVCYVSLDNEMLISQYPADFKQWMSENTAIKSLNTEYGLYRCWVYISKLIHICKQIKTIDESWENFFQKYQLNVRDLTKKQYYKMIDHLLSYIQRLNESLLRVTNFTELEFNCIQKLLKIDKVKYTRERIFPELKLSESKSKRRYKTTHFQIYGKRTFEFPENLTAFDILRENNTSQLEHAENESIDIWELALINKYKIKNPRFIYNIGRLITYLNENKLNLAQKSRCFYYS